MLAITPEQLHSHLDDIAVADVGSLNALVGGEESITERIDLLASVDRDADPEHASALGEAKERFRAAFQRLPDREQRVAVLLYVQNMTLREVGEILGVSESRVCQIHAGLRRTLRAALDEHAGLFAEVA